MAKILNSEFEFHCLITITNMSQQFQEVAETEISAGPSRVTGPAELNEMVQYAIFACSTALAVAGEHKLP